MKNTICDSFPVSLGLPQKYFGDAMLPININITEHTLFSALVMVTLLSKLSLFVVCAGEVVTALCQHLSSLTELKAAMTSGAGKIEMAFLVHRGLVFLFLDFTVLGGKIIMTIWYFCSLCWVKPRNEVQCENAEGAMWKAEGAGAL